MFVDRLEQWGEGGFEIFHGTMDVGGGSNKPVRFLCAISVDKLAISD